MFNIWKQKAPEKAIQKKRVDPRLDVYHLAKYKLASNSEDKELPIAYVRNISGGGVCLETQDEIPTLSIIQLLINMPGLDQPISTMAEICWSKKVGKKNIKYKHGIKFLKIDEIMRQSIRKKINNVSEKLGHGKRIIKRQWVNTEKK